MIAAFRSRLRAYGAALLLGAAAVGAVPELRVINPVAIVRPYAVRRAPFDAVERLEAHVMTMPLEFGATPDWPRQWGPGHLN